MFVRTAEVEEKTRVEAVTNKVWVLEEAPSLLRLNRGL